MNFCFVGVNTCILSAREKWEINSVSANSSNGQVQEFDFI